MKLGPVAVLTAATLSQTGRGWLAQAPFDVMKPLGAVFKKPVKTPLSRALLARPMRVVPATQLKMRQYDELGPNLDIPTLRLGRALLSLTEQGTVTVQLGQKRFALPDNIDLPLLEKVELENRARGAHVPKTISAPRAGEGPYFTVSIKENTVELMWELSAEEQEAVVYSDDEDIDYYHLLKIPRAQFSKFLAFIAGARNQTLDRARLESLIQKPTLEPGIIRADQRHCAEAKPFG